MTVPKKVPTKVHNKVTFQILSLYWPEWLISHISLRCSISKQTGSIISAQNLRVTQLNAFKIIKYNPRTFETLTLPKLTLLKLKFLQKELVQEHTAGQALSFFTLVSFITTPCDPSLPSISHIYGIRNSPEKYFLVQGFHRFPENVRVFHSFSGNIDWLLVTFAFTDILSQEDL